MYKAFLLGLTATPSNYPYHYECSETSMRIHAFLNAPPPNLLGSRVADWIPNLCPPCALTFRMAYRILIFNIWDVVYKRR